MWVTFVLAEEKWLPVVQPVARIPFLAGSVRLGAFLVRTCPIGSGGRLRKVRSRAHLIIGAPASISWSKGLFGRACKGNSVDVRFLLELTPPLFVKVRQL